MQIALVDGERAVPAPGVQGVCQMCGQPMVAKCGPQVIWHWAHRGRRICTDPWWENEGEWHRGWKAMFPISTHEQVMFAADGEKHIADVRLASGLVVELQHSAMPLDEMKSREAFYRRMIWIVDAAPFLSNLTVFDPLPDPKLDFTRDLIIYPPHPAWRNNLVRRGMNYDSLMFARRSKQTPGSTMVMMEGGDRLDEDFATTYRGHHLFLWMRPREVWYRTTRPTYLDFGDGRVARLMVWRPEPLSPLCLKFFTKESLISRLLQGQPD